MDNLNCKMQQKGLPIKTIVERSIIRYYPRNTGEVDFSVLTCDDAS